jgi:hypothetical protein
MVSDSDSDSSVSLRFLVRFLDRRYVLYMGLKAYSLHLRVKMLDLRTHDSTTILRLKNSPPEKVAKGERKLQNREHIWSIYIFVGQERTAATRLWIACMIL